MRSSSRLIISRYSFDKSVCERMMKDVFAKRAISNFFDLARDFSESLCGAFPDCEGTRDWKLWLDNVVGDDEARRKEVIDNWIENARRPLKKGSAKYMKAVQSITGKPAMVYHAIAYHDAEATHATDEMLQTLDVPKKLKQLDDEARKIFWQYLEEMNNEAYRASRATLPNVPTVQQIADDISKRKRVSAASAEFGATNSALPPTSSTDGTRLHHGVWEIWQRLCESRGVNTGKHTAETVGASLEAMLKEHECMEADCRAKLHTAQAVLFSRFPELVVESKVDLSDEQWSLIEKAINLTSMQRSIPPAMMNGIESVAQQLMQDLESGKSDLSSINLEQIGQQVLHSVSEDDVSAFASNLDKILPALERIHGSTPQSENQ